MSSGVWCYDISRTFLANGATSCLVLTCVWCYEVGGARRRRLFEGRGQACGGGREGGRQPPIGTRRCPIGCYANAR
eukprot:3459017-Rhodomonas_salina.1